MSKENVTEGLLKNFTDKEMIEHVFDQYMSYLDENNVYVNPKEMARYFIKNKERKYIVSMCFEIQISHKNVNNPNYDLLRKFASKYINDLVSECKSK